MHVFYSLFNSIILALYITGNVHFNVWENQTGECLSSRHLPVVTVLKEDRHKCNITITNKADDMHGNFNYCIDFMVESVQHSCRIKCFTGSSRKTITIYEHGK